MALSFNVWWFIYLAGKIETGVVYLIRKDAFKHLQELTFSYYDKTPIGWLMARLTSDCSNLGSTIAWGLVDFFWGTMTMLFFGGAMLFFNWKLALIALSVLPPLILVSIYFQKIILRSYRNVRKINSKITSSLAEGIHGAKTTKTLLREEDNLSDFQNITSEMYKSSVLVAIKSSLFFPIVLFLGTIGSGFVIWFGGEGLIKGNISYGTLIAFIAYMTGFFMPIRQLAAIFANLQNTQASAERIFSLLETEPEITDEKVLLNLYKNHPDMSRLKNRKKLIGEIELKNVCFSYKKDISILEDFNLKIKAGESIAIVGETGGGKSTLVNLICRFYEPTAGKIFIDGKDYTTIPLNQIQSNIGMVLQTPHLFSGSIKENIKYGNLGASEDEIEKAATLVNAHEFISALKNGYETQIGEGGDLLSIGQKQLITFARAIISNPASLILDDATSSVDTIVEAKIQSALTTLLKGRTSLIIAHRLSTIRDADRILVINKGKIIESGSHLELLEKKGRYYSLHTKQFINETEKAIVDRNS